MPTHFPRYAIPAIVFALAVLLALPASQTAVAGGPTIHVDETADELNADGDCSLREAMKATRENAAVDACPAGHPLGPDQIVLESGTTYQLSIVGDGDDEGDLNTGGASANPLFMRSEGGNAHAVIDANGIDRVMQTAFGGDVDITRIDFTGGVSDDRGGGIRNDGTIALTDVRITNNTSGSFGGGLYAHLNADSTVVSSIFDGNFSDAGGGGISQGGTIMVADTVITGNTVEDGAGGAPGTGGGLNTSGTAVVTDSTISDNTAVAAGGGVHSSGDSVTIERSVITGNTSGFQGGAIYHGGSTIVGVMDLVNVTISGNTSQSAGVLTTRSDTTNLLNVTFADNASIESDSQNLSAIFNGLINVQNSILSTDDGNNCGIAGTISLGNNLESGDTCGFDTGSGDIINTDPMLGPLQDNGGPTVTHALLAGSRALSAANQGACPDDDQRGAPRPQGDGCDIGAYESSFNAPPPTPTPSPSPTPSPAPTPGPALIQGDNDCDTTDEEDPDVDAVDALVGLQFVAALPYSQQPDCVPIGNNLAPAVLPAGDPPDHFGDVDCDLDVDAVDALQILRHVAGLPVNQDDPCTDIGDPL